ncbi:MAG: ABC transporter permease subunit [Desulfobacterium sp.]|nr:ABC transporter permease subunit [Desulfobacterium sp.]
MPGPGSCYSFDRAQPLRHKNPLRKTLHTKRTLFLPLLLTGCLLCISWHLYKNVSANLARQAITTGFEFLTHEAAFEIGESPISFSAADSYARALVVGFLNTLKAGLAGMGVALVLGLAVGMARLSSHSLVSFAAACHVELLRNVPALLQLFFWYAILNSLLPSPRHALNPCWGVFLSNRGIMFPALEFHLAESVGGILGGVSLGWSVPCLAGFNFKGGTTFSLEFTALVLGLGVYTSAFVAEAVRAGITAIGRDQWEAGKALGMHPSVVFRRIIFPQALRVIIPPVTGLMLGLMKNSSLAVAIGYPDFLSIGNTAINQTGQVVEGVMIIMVVYLALSLVTSFAMKKYDAYISKGWIG